MAPKECGKGSASSCSATCPEEPVHTKEQGIQCEHTNYLYWMWCGACQMYLNGPTQWEDHQIGKKHRKNMRPLLKIQRWWRRNFVRWFATKLAWVNEVAVHGDCSTVTLCDLCGEMLCRVDVETRSLSIMQLANCLAMHSPPLKILDPHALLRQARQAQRNGPAFGVMPGRANA